MRGRAMMSCLIAARTGPVSAECGWPRWSRCCSSITSTTSEKGIVLTQGYYGICHMAEYSITLGASCNPGERFPSASRPAIPSPPISLPSIMGINSVPARALGDRSLRRCIPKLQQRHRRSSGDAQEVMRPEARGFPWPPRVAETSAPCRWRSWGILSPIRHGVGS